MKFIKRQVSQMWSGGWPVLREKASRAVHMTLSPPENWQKMRCLSDKLQKVVSKFSFKSPPQSGQAAIPLAVYDLRVNPVTFDFACFLCGADFFFSERGCAAFRVVVVHQMNIGASEYSTIVDHNARRKRIFNMILPMAHLYKNCTSVELIHDLDLVKNMMKKTEVLYPENHDGIFLRNFSYKYVFDREKTGAEFSGFTADKKDIATVRKWLDRNSIKNKFVTFTVRQYEWEQGRNSNIKAYLEFSSYLTSIGIDSVYIPDTENPFLDIEDRYFIFAVGSFNLYLRMALYELAVVNIFTNNGPAALCHLNKNCSFISSGICNENEPNTRMDVFTRRGLQYGDQPFCSNRGVWEWGPETVDSLMTSFEKLCKKNPSILDR